MTIFCDRAKTRMKELHITTRQLAKSIGMTESTVSRYLSGNRSPKIEELVKIAETLECSADYLLGLKESEVVVQKEIFKKLLVCLINCQMTEHTGEKKMLNAELHGKMVGEHSAEENNRCF